MTDDGFVLLAGGLLVAGLLTYVISFVGLGPWDVACWLQVICPP